jgi:hypothetical protein
MSLEDSIKAVLAADGTFAGLMTGGIYAYEDTGLLGFSRDSIPAAFDSNGRVKPSCVVKVRAAIPDSQIRDEDAQLMSYRQVVEIWLYEALGYDTILAATVRAFALLHGKRIASRKLLWAGDLPTFFDEGMGFNSGRTDFQANGVRTAS